MRLGLNRGQLNCGTRRRRRTRYPKYEFIAQIFPLLVPYQHLIHDLSKPVDNQLLTVIIFLLYRNESNL